MKLQRDSGNFNVFYIVELVTLSFKIIQIRTFLLKTLALHIYNKISHETSPRKFHFIKKFDILKSATLQCHHRGKKKFSGIGISEKLHLISGINIFKMQFSQGKTRKKGLICHP